MRARLIPLVPIVVGVAASPGLSAHGVVQTG
jgi:hypothetical protein